MEKTAFLTRKKARIILFTSSLIIVLLISSVVQTIKANRYETYLNKIEKPKLFKYGDLLPKDLVLNYKEEIIDEFVSLSVNQIKQRYDKDISLTDQEIEEISENEDRLFVDYRAKYGDDAYEEWLNFEEWL